MYRHWRSPLSLVLLCSIGSSVTPLTARASDDVGGFVDLARLKHDLQASIAEARLVDPNPPFFIVRQIDLKLQGVRRLEGSGAFSIPIWVFGLDLGAGGTLEQSAKLELELIPPDRGLVGGTNLVDFSPLVRTLKEAFVADRGDGLLAASVKYTRTWALQRAAEGEADAVVIKIGGGISDEKAQSVTFRVGALLGVDVHACKGRNRE